MSTTVRKEIQNVAPPIARMASGTQKNSTRAPRKIQVARSPPPACAWEAALYCTLGVVGDAFTGPPTTSLVSPCYALAKQSLRAGHQDNGHQNKDEERFELRHKEDAKRP